MAARVGAQRQREINHFAIAVASFPLPRWNGFILWRVPDQPRDAPHFFGARPATVLAMSGAVGPLIRHRRTRENDPLTRALQSRRTATFGYQRRDAASSRVRNLYHRVTGSFHRITSDQIKARRLVGSLNPEQLRVRSRLVEGYSLNAMANGLRIYVAEIEKVRSEILRKFGAHTTADLIGIWHLFRNS